MLRRALWLACRRPPPASAALLGERSRPRVCLWVRVWVAQCCWASARGRACVFVGVGVGGSTARAACARARALGRSGGAVARERPNPNTHHMQIIIQSRPLTIKTSNSARRGSGPGGRAFRFDAAARNATPKP